MVKIRFCEPASNSEYGDDFDVTDEFFKILLLDPKAMTDFVILCNCYLFGNMFPLDEYKYLGFETNNLGQIGLIDVNTNKIIFLDDTVGGNVGASLYAHYDSFSNIDSLIIDNNYFFNNIGILS